MIRTVKVNGKTKYRVVSHTTGANLGTFDTRREAEEELKRRKRFSEHKK